MDKKSLAFWQDKAATLSIEGRAFIDGEYRDAAGGRTFDCLSPIDGTHRMAVLSGLRLLPEAAFAAKKLAKPSNEQNVWMGKHKDGELPNAP